MFKKTFLASCLLLVLPNAHAVTNSTESTISQITVGSTFARIKLEVMTSMESCTQQNYYYLDLSNGQNKEMLSAALAAKVAKTPVIIQASGCNTFPLISHIYLN